MRLLYDNNFNSRKKSSKINNENKALNNAESEALKEPLEVNAVKRQINMKVREVEEESLLAFNETAKQNLNDDLKRLKSDLNEIDGIQEDANQQQIELLNSLLPKLKNIQVIIYLFLFYSIQLNDYQILFLNIIYNLEEAN